MPCFCKISNCATIISEIAFLYWKDQKLKAHTYWLQWRLLCSLWQNQTQRKRKGSFL